MTAMNGGKFWSGFAAGAVSSIVSSAWSYDGNGNKTEAGFETNAFGSILGLNGSVENSYKYGWKF